MAEVKKMESKSKDKEFDKDGKLLWMKLRNGFVVKTDTAFNTIDRRNKMSDWTVYTNPVRQSDGTMKNLYQVGRIINKDKVEGGENHSTIWSSEDKGKAQGVAGSLNGYEKAIGVKLFPIEFQQMVRQNKFSLEKSKKANTVEDIIKQKITECLEKGEQPFWTKDFWNKTAHYFNFERPDKPYQTYNCILLSGGCTTVYGTDYGWEKVGGKLKEDAKSDLVVGIVPRFYLRDGLDDARKEEALKFLEDHKTDYEILFDEAKKEDGLLDVSYGLKLNTVYSMDYVDGLKPEFVEKQKKILAEKEHSGAEQNRDIEKSSMEIADAIVSSWIKESGVKLRHVDVVEAAHYTPSTHSITMPNKKQFNNESSYYEVIFHEMAHSTQVMVERTDRYTTKQEKIREELVAEMTACALLNYCGIQNELQDKRNMAYLESWNGKLKDFDGKNFVYATIEAQKAFNAIVGIYEKELDFSKGIDAETKKEKESVGISL